MSLNSSKPLLYEDAYLCMFYDEETNCIVKQWKQSVSENKFKELIIQLLIKIVNTRLQLRKNINLIADCRKMGEETFTNEVIDWLNQHVHKVYAMNKITKKAFIAPDTISSDGQLASYISSARLEGNFSMKLFTDIEMAKSWLKN